MQLKYHMVTIEDLVPQNHFLRKLETVLDLTFIYKGNGTSAQPEVRSSAHQLGGYGAATLPNLWRIK